MSDLVVEELAEDRFGEWERLLDGSPESNPYARPAYLGALCSAAGGVFRLLVVRRGDEVVGGVPLHEVAGRLGPSVIPRPLLYYNGPILQHHATRYPSEETGRQVQVLSALAAALGARRYARLVLRTSPSLLDARPFLAAGWSAAPEYTYTVAIEDMEAARARVEHNLHRLARRARAAGLTVSEDEDFGSFHGLHLSTCRRAGIAPYLAKGPFERWFQALRSQGACRLFQARLPGGRAVAAVLVLTGPGKTCHTVAAATDPEHRSSGAAPFLRIESFAALSAVGYATIDLTDAALNQVTHFKAQLGGALRVLLRLEAPASLAMRASRTLARVARAALAWPARIGSRRQGRAA